MNQYNQLYQDILFLDKNKYSIYELEGFYINEVDIPDYIQELILVKNSLGNPHNTKNFALIWKTKKSIKNICVNYQLRLYLGDDIEKVYSTILQIENIKNTASYEENIEDLHDRILSEEDAEKKRKKAQLAKKQFIINLKQTVKNHYMKVIGVFILLYGCTFLVFPVKQYLLNKKLNSVYNQYIDCIPSKQESKEFNTYVKRYYALGNKKDSYVQMVEMYEKIKLCVETIDKRNNKILNKHYEKLVKETENISSSSELDLSKFEKCDEKMRGELKDSKFQNARETGKYWSTLIKETKKNIKEEKAFRKEKEKELARQMKEKQEKEEREKRERKEQERKRKEEWIKREEERIKQEEDKNIRENIISQLLNNFIKAYTIDMNNHEYYELDPYVESDVASNDHFSVYYQMHKQFNGEFDQVLSERFLQGSIRDITRVSDTKYLVSVYQKHDVDQVLTYGELLQMDTGKEGRLAKSIASQTLEILYRDYGYDYFEYYDEIVIGKISHENIVYDIRLSDDGTWKMYRYDQPIDFISTMPEIYSAEYRSY